MKQETKKILVLGSAGTIGSRLCQEISQNGDKVINFDIKDGRHHDLSNRKNYNFLLEEMFGSDFVYFLAFDIGGAKYLYNKQGEFDFINNNMKIMSNVFEALSHSKKPFIFISSMMASMDWSTYGKLKSIGEQYVKSVGTGITVRFWNVYGNESVGEKSHVIPDFINQAKELSQITMMTPGDEVRQFIHVSDACKALESIRMAHTTKDPVAVDLFSRGEVIDVSSGSWIQIKHIANTIAFLLCPCVVVPGEKKDLVQLNLTVEPNLRIIESKPFCWQPKINLVTGIQMLISEYRGFKL
jgi:nucleoside-diphosphate-sugar epimerase